MFIFLLFSTLVSTESSGFESCWNDPCPPWQYNSNGTCICSWHQFHTLVQCKNDPYDLQLQRCYCMTCGQHKVLVGACQFTCTGEFYEELFFPVNTDNVSTLNYVMCGSHNRQGQMCGRCKPGYAPPVYSYSLSCVNCTTSNWGKYTAVSLLPLTAFFVFVITFRISATSPILHGLVLSLQMLTCPFIMRLLQVNFHDRDSTIVQRNIVAGKVISSLIGIWNLDFFRLVYSPFCLHPDTNTLQVITLDYLIAVYPLLLIGLSYLLVLLYDHNVRLAVWLFKPFVSLFIRFRRQWNIRNSLVDAFATFLLLSYVKILSVSVDLLLPVTLYDQNGNQLPQLYLLNQGDVAYFSNQHLPYACLALLFLFIFTLLPMFLLFLYPCSCFQVCLNHTGVSCQSLHIFMDSFQGHYKNGTNGTHDCRYFSALFLLIRLLVYFSFMFVYLSKSVAYTSAILLTFTVATSFIKPFKKPMHNITFSLSLLLLTLSFMFLLPLGIVTFSGYSKYNYPIYLALIFFWLAYISIYLFLVLIPVKKLCPPVFEAVKKTLLQLRKRYPSNRDGYQSLQSF